jgi:mannose-1-phosphate guanylyltransferase
MTFNSSGNITHISGDKLVVLQGLHDFIVIDHDNTLLICKKEEEQEIKKIVEVVGKK